MERTIYCEREVCEHLGIPSIPKRVWDGKSSFRDGVAVVELCDGSEAYAVATFDADSDTSPTVKKVFTLERFLGVREVYVVPPYMDGDVQSFDLSDEDKRKAQAILDEAKELEMEGVEQPAPDMPENEYFFDSVHSDEEAMAFIKAYNRANRIRGRVPTGHEEIVMKLSVMYADLQKNNKKGKSR